MRRLDSGFRLQRPDWTVDPLLARRRRPWGGLLASVLAHSLLVLLLLGLLTSHREKPRETPAAAASTLPQVSMIYLPPPPRAAPPPRPSPPPRTQPVSPDAVHAPAPAPSRGAETRPDEVSGHEAAGTKPPAPDDPKSAPPAERLNTAPAAAQPSVTLSTAPLAPDTATMVSEAQRIFGSSRKIAPNDAVGLGAPTLPGERYEAERTNCIPPPRDSGQAAEMAEISGVIFQPNHRPLVGALLQIVGTQYSAFSDDRGYYKLVFDASLVTQCRTQYVRVTAHGFRARDLILGLGPGVNDVTLQRF